MASPDHEGSSDDMQLLITAYYVNLLLQTSGTHYYYMYLENATLLLYPIQAFQTSKWPQHLFSQTNGTMLLSFQCMYGGTKLQWTFPNCCRRN